MMNSFSILILLAAAVGSLEAWGSDKVKLTDIKTLTLYHGQMTTGRRSKPVPQVHCVGGTAGCSSFIPQVVQCYNRGSDGYDVQWECKTDMDNAYRFGRVDVICEGYEYPDDPYILKGSCGLEYNIDFTEEGLKRKGQGHNYYGNSQDHIHKTSYYTGTPRKTTAAWFSDMILTIILVLLVIALLKTCVRFRQYSPTDGDYSNPSPGFGSGSSSGSQPPPPGFRTDFGQGGGCGASTMGPSGGVGGTGGAGGFWTGAATGGILGYMFGNRNSRYNYNYDQPYTRTWDRSGTWGGFSGGGGGTWGGSSGGSGSGSTGTRTASGFGGTRRR